MYRKTMILDERKREESYKSDQAEMIKSSLPIHCLQSPPLKGHLAMVAPRISPEKRAY